MYGVNDDKYGEHGECTYLILPLLSRKTDLQVDIRAFFTYKSPLHAKKELHSHFFHPFHAYMAHKYEDKVENRV